MIEESSPVIRSDQGVPVQVQLIHHNNSTQFSNETFREVGKQIVPISKPKCQSSDKLGPFVSNGREWGTVGGVVCRPIRAVGGAWRLRRGIAREGEGEER